MSRHITEPILESCERVSQILKSLSHPVRLKVLCQVIDEERTVNELTNFCEISQSAMSQFLKRMKQEGLVTSRREGTQIFYRIASDELIKLLRAIKQIYC